MARCGCGSCSCLIQADPNCPSVTVSGVGTATNPYLICSSGGGIGEVITDFGDMIYVGYSKSYRAPYELTLTNLTAHVFALSTTPIVFDVLRNGIALQTFTIPALTRELVVTGLSYVYVAGDYYQFYVSSAGSGGLGLVTQGALV